MPFLTRDFAVFLGIVTFLVAGIFVTVSEDYFGNSQLASVVQFAENEEQYGVVEEKPTENNRSATLAALKDKVADYMKSVAVSKPKVTEEPEPSTVVDVEEVVDNKVQVCSTYHTYSKPWNPKGLKFEVVEGARLVYREEAGVPVMVGTSTVSAPVRDVLVQLPLRSFPNQQAACLPGDVIGIATDGSLIRNNEVGLYSVFGSETLIGYALDGFPIYGAGETKLDKCGGKTVAGEYGYYLDTKREGVINCYFGSPETI